jgi:hypothetical protein
MPAAQRAKQFMPFKAVTGLEAALRKKEHDMGLTDRIELSDDMAADINRTLISLSKECTACVTYFDKGEYVTYTGKVKSIDTAFKAITIDEIRIPIDNIIAISESY